MYTPSATTFSHFLHIDFTSKSVTACPQQYVIYNYHFKNWKQKGRDQRGQTERTDREEETEGKKQRGESEGKRLKGRERGERHMKEG